jgi:hypothetical protein
MTGKRSPRSYGSVSHGDDDDRYAAKQIAIILRVKTAAGVPGSVRTHGAVALVHRSGHPFASHVEKLVSNFLISCQARYGSLCREQKWRSRAENQQLAIQFRPAVRGSNKAKRCVEPPRRAS